MKILIVFFCINVGISASYAQYAFELQSAPIEKISINLNDGTISKPLPFDRSFKLDIEGRKTDVIVDAYLFEVEFIKESGKRIRQLVRKEISLTKKNGKYQPNGIELSDEELDHINQLLKNEVASSKIIERALPMYDLEPKKTSESKYLIPVPALKPNSYIDIALIHKLSEPEFKSLYAIHNLIFEDNDYRNISSISSDYSTKFNEACIAYGEFKSKLEEQIYSSKRQYFNESFDGYMSFFKKNILPIYNSIENEDFTKNSKDINLHQLEVVSTRISSIGGELDDIAKLYTLAKEKKRILKGMISIEHTEETKQFDFANRSQNITSSLQIITKAIVEANKVKALDVNSVIVNNLLNSLISIKNKLAENKNFLLEKDNKIKKQLSQQYKYSEWLSTTTIEQDIKIRNGQTIIPDFGLINIIAFQNDGSIYYIPRPYIGINLHLRPIDKDQSFKTLEKRSFWHYSSISLGLTLGKIDERGFSDFYNSMSLAIGYNLRVSKQIRVGFGTVLLREEDENPIISRKKIEPALYGNVSFDFNLFETIGKLATKIFI